jgi:hypothetical protein
MVIRAVRLSMAVAVLGILSMTIQPALAQNGIVFTTQQVTGFSLKAGQPSWEQRDLDRLRGAQWYFDNNGSFVLQLPNFGLPPIRGNFAVPGSAIVFQGGSQTSYGHNGGTSVEVHGQVINQNGTPMLHLIYVAGQATAAVINNTPFGQSKTNAYEATAVLQLSGRQ